VGWSFHQYDSSGGFQLRAFSCTRPLIFWLLPPEYLLPVLYQTKTPKMYPYPAPFASPKFGHVQQPVLHISCSLAYWWPGYNARTRGINNSTSSKITHFSFDNTFQSFHFRINFDFWEKLWFFGEILDFWKKCLIFGRNSWFWEKCLIFGKMFDFWKNVWFLEKCLIFGKMFDFLGKCLIFRKILAFSKSYHFCKISIWKEIGLINSIWKKFDLKKIDLKKNRFLTNLWQKNFKNLKIFTWAESAVNSLSSCRTW